MIQTRGGGWYNLGNLGTDVRASILKPFPIIYLAFEKYDLFIYLIVQGEMKISFERNTLKVTWYETATQFNLSINPGVLWYKRKGNLYFHNTCSVTSSVNNSISLLDLRGQLV